MQPVEITNNIWIAERADAVGADAVLAIASIASSASNEVSRHVFEIPNTAESDAEITPATLFAFSNTLRGYAGQRVLLTSDDEGAHRAAGMFVAHLMIENSWTRKQAMEFVVSKMLTLDLSDGFMNRLAALETSIQYGMLKVD